LEASFDTFMNPPFFPICIHDMPGEITFHDTSTGSFDVGPVRVTACEVPHVGTTFGYRIDWGGVSVAYVSDHQQPVDDPRHVDEAVLELVDGVDLLIHDAQFTPEEFAERSNWGHCTVDYALEVAHQAAVGELVLFHHDPAHCDGTIDGILATAVERAVDLDIGSVTAAMEGRTVQLRPASAPATTS